VSEEVVGVEGALSLFIEEFRHFREEYREDRKDTVRRFDAGEARMGQIEMAINTTQINIAGILQEDRRRNGSIERLLNWQHRVDNAVEKLPDIIAWREAVEDDVAQIRQNTSVIAEMQQGQRDAVNVAKGRKQQRAADLAKISAVKGIVEDYWLSWGLGALAATAITYLFTRLLL
jgi:hypothetical protein